MTHWRLVKYPHKKWRRLTSAEQAINNAEEFKLWCCFLFYTIILTQTKKVLNFKGELMINDQR